MMATSSQGSAHDKLLDDYDKQAKLVSALHNARDALAHDGGSTDPTRIAQVQQQYKKAVDELNDINKKLITIQRQTEQDIQNTSESIRNYRRTLNNNHKLFQKYSNDIKHKMQLVATRDRMLQLSQERNMYKKKVIYVLFSIVIALLVAIISAYTVYGKMAKK
jgi:tetrahydromethanopterin S-methyltransferase subunit F